MDGVFEPDKHQLNLVMQPLASLLIALLMIFKRCPCHKAGALSLENTM